MALITRDQFLGAKPPHKIVPTYLGDVRVQGLSLIARNALVDAYLGNIEAVKVYEEDQAKPESERQGIAKATLIDQYALTMIFAIADEHGDPMFGIDDLGVFEQMDHLTLKRLYDAFSALNDAPTAEAITAKKKRSAKTPQR